MEYNASMNIYPAALPTDIDYPDRVDDDDWIYAARYNEIKEEVIAICAELGTNPKADAADLKTRLAISLDADGALKATLTPTFSGLTINGTIYASGNITTDGSVDGVDIAGMSAFVILNTTHRLLTLPHIDWTAATQNLLTTGKVTGSDFYTAAACNPLSKKLVEFGITITDHFRAATIPSGYAWLTGGVYQAPTSVSYNHDSDYLRCRSSGGKSYLYKAQDVRDTRMYARVVVNQGVNGGLRYDDGTDNNYVEIRLIHTTGNTMIYRQRVVTGGGEAVDTDVTLNNVAPTAIMLRVAGTPNHNAYTDLVNEVGGVINMSSVLGLTWTPTRAGIVVDGAGYLIMDWFSISGV